MSTTAKPNNPLERVSHSGQKVAHEASTSHLMEGLMRLGYVVRGLVYAVIGVLAFQVALGMGGSLNDPQGAIANMGATPVGAVLLIGILIGLLGYALWGIIRAVFDPLHKGSDPKGMATRAGYFASGVSYALLAIATYGLITGGSSAARNGAQTAQTQQTTASILSNSWGPWVVGLVGLIIIGVGVAQIIQGLQRNFDQQFRSYSLSANQMKWIERIGRFGTAARGLVFGLVGVFLFLAAYRHDPSQAQGLDGVLSAILHQSYGPWLLGIVSLGLLAFGLYSIMEGYWLRLKR